MSAQNSSTATQPMNIPASNAHNHTRARSASVYSASSLSSVPALSNSPNISPKTPSSPTLPIFTYPSGRFPSSVTPAMPPSPTKPGFVSLFSQTSIKSPSGATKTNLGFNASALDEDEDDVHDGFSGDFPSVTAHHARRVSVSWANNDRYASVGPGVSSAAGGGGVGATPGAVDGQRGSGLLRRLSLGSAFRPNPASFAQAPGAVPLSAPGAAALIPEVRRTSPVPVIRRPSPRKGNTLGLGGLGVDPVKKRSVSPMGERMLKGHFDGFN